MEATARISAARFNSAPSGVTMKSHHVKLGITPCLRLECTFWLEEDGWCGDIESSGIRVHAPSFVAAKNDMELELGEHIGTLLKAHGNSERGRAA